MSTRVPQCEGCQHDMRFAGVEPVDDALFETIWICEGCRRSTRDRVSVLPLVPDAACCPACGARLQDQAPARCPSCNRDEREIIRELGTDAMPRDPLAVTTALFAEGLVKRGLALLDAALLANPKLWDAWMVKAQFAEGIGDHESAAVIWEAAVDAGAPPALEQRLGNALARSQHPAEAIAAYQRCLEARPDSETAATAHDGLARVHQTLGELPHAERHYRRAIVLQPRRVRHRTALVRFFTATGRSRAAMDTLEAAAGLEPPVDDLGALHCERAALAADLDEVDVALTAAKLAIAMAPFDARANYLLGRALALAGRTAPALEQMQRTLSLSPNHEDATRAIEVLQAKLGGRAN